MSHVISGIITKASMAQQFAKSSEIHAPAILSKDYGFLPLSDVHLDMIFSDRGQIDGSMTYLSDALKAVLIEMSANGPVAYIETEYFGGEGIQGAVVYDQSLCVYGPISGELSVISEALKLLGVKLEPGFVDEFEMIGLCRYRNNDDWIEEGSTC